MSDLIADLPEDDMLAAEYVLGVSGLPERAEAESRIKADPAFAARVHAWEADLAALNAGYAEVPPPPGLLPRIEARLFPAPKRARRPGWLGFLGGAVAAGILGAAVLIALPRSDAPGPALTASLTADAQPLVFEAAYLAGTLRVSRTAGDAAGAGQSYELWLIAGASAPVSLGLIEGRAVELPLPILAPGAVLAVSLEPAGGSTTGAPTGPVLVSGTIGA